MLWTLTCQVKLHLQITSVNGSAAESSHVVAGLHRVSDVTPKHLKSLKTGMQIHK